MPDSVEINPTGMITEYVHPEYHDTTPKSGTEFDAETEEMFRSLSDFYRLDHEERKAILNDFFRPYITHERSFRSHLRNPEMAPRAIELLRQVYSRYRFDTEAGNQDWTERSFYRDDSDFSPEFLSRSVVASLDEFDLELERTDLDEKALRRLRNNIFYVVSEAQDTNNSQSRYKIDTWIERHFDELEALDPFFWEPSDASQDQIALYARRNFFIHGESGILAKRHLDSLVHLHERTSEINASQEIDKNIIDPILLEEGKRENLQFIWRRENLARGMAERYGLNPNIVNKWKEAKVRVGTGPDGDRFTESYAENLLAVARLEKMRPGSARALYEQYGIANFARYDSNILLRQLDVADKDPRYGVVIYPEADWNGAFFQNAQQLYDASLQLRVGGFETRIVEAGSQRELARRLLRLHKKYSPAGNKFSFSIIGGHGSPNSLALGNDKSLDPPPFPDPTKSDAERERELEAWRNSISTDTGSFETGDLLEGDGINRALEEWFEPNAPKVLVSCSTGAEGGIAERASTQTSGEIIAPKIPTNIKKIAVTFNREGQPEFSVEYSKGEAARYAAGKSK